MRIEVDGNGYDLELADNPTAGSIAEHAPFALRLERYGGAEYQASLPFEPDSCAGTTSRALAGWAYYWDGWNALVLNFEDRDIAPYEVVPVGRLGSGDVAAALRACGPSIEVRLG